MLNAANGTLGVAILRAIYSAVVAGAIAAIAAYQTGGKDTNDAILVGVAAALSILATRGGIEGLSDRQRQITNDVTPADVQAGTGNA